MGPTQHNPRKTEKSRPNPTQPNPTQPMGQPNPWTTLQQHRIKMSAIDAAALGIFKK